ncbi:OmpA family protein [Nannocystis bainbridge]|uniref:OmpA family protein n=1 Tax=Nannocystis bainbridge TaxID=2995303 RepID=A0ABT5DXG6_9BACT|nr:OmpA family protein [Nannocystis bainbridge]MDC0718283.1 OmpA family protein [Nannocystis bainbridge]
MRPMRWMRWSRLVLVSLCACRPAAPAEPQAPSAPDLAEPAPAEPAPAEPAPVEPSAPVEPIAYQLDGNRLVLPRPLDFAATADVPGRGSEIALEHVRGYLRAKPSVTQVRIEGHFSGPDAQAMSERRALAVARELVRMGIDCQRLYPVGFGDTKPLVDGSTPEGRAQNNRIEVHNVALRGRVIGGMPADGGGRPAGDPCS